MKLSDFPILETERCILRLLRAGDVEEIFQLRGNRALVTYVDRPLAETKQDARDFIQMILEGIQADQWINWAITLKKEDQLIGTLGYWHYHETLPQAEVGYELLPEYHGRGIMSEAMECILPYAWNCMQLKTIEAFVHEQNSKSIKVLKRCHFVFDPNGRNDKEPAMERWILRKDEVPAVLE